MRISCTGGTKGVHYIKGFYTFVVPLLPNAHFLIIVPSTLLVPLVTIPSIRSYVRGTIRVRGTIIPSVSLSYTGGTKGVD